MTTELEKVLRHFTVDEFLDSVLPELPSVSWPSIKNNIQKDRVNLNMKVAAKYIIETKKIRELDPATLNETVAVLKLLETACHSHRQTWTAYQLLGMREDPMPEEVIQERLKRECRLANLHGIVKVVTSRNIQWISITLKKLVKGKGLKLLSPAVFAYCSGYLFLSRKNFSAQLIIVMKMALGYKHVRKAKLTGKRIESLLRYLKMKDQHSLDDKSGPNWKKDFVLKAGTFTKKNSNYDFARDEIRRKYAETVFGTDPPVLEVMKISTPECPWRGLKAVPSMAGQKMDCSVVFQSKNVFEMLQKMTERGQLVAPYPEFFRKIPTIGKNEIAVKHVPSG